MKVGRWGYVAALAAMAVGLAALASCNSKSTEDCPYTVVCNGNDLVMRYTCDADKAGDTFDVPLTSCGDTKECRGCAANDGACKSGKATTRAVLKDEATSDTGDTAAISEDGDSDAATSETADGDSDAELPNDPVLYYDCYPKAGAATDGDADSDSDAASETAAR